MGNTDFSTQYKITLENMINTEEYGNVICITTPVMDYSNDCVEVYVVKNDTGFAVETDLLSFSFDPETAEKQRKLAKTIAEHNFGCAIEKDYLRRICKEEKDIGIAIHMASMAYSAISFATGFFENNAT